MSFVIKRLNPNIGFLVVGDFEQLEPVKDRVKCDYKNSRALYEICNGHRLELTKCKRSDDELFNICKDPLNAPLSKFGKEKSNINICYTNKKRIEINEYYMNLAIKTKHDYTKIGKYKYDKNSQDMKINVGTPIIARITSQKYNVSNNEQFEIISIKKGEVKFGFRDDNGAMIEMLETVNVNMFARVFHVAYCITVHKSQGSTIKENYTIHEWNKFDQRLAYVALSRGTDIKNINIV